MYQDRLWDMRQLMEAYPAFKEWGVRWLVRHRRIPVVRIGRRIYFDPEDINRWVEKNKISELGDENA
ncbi:MAG: helix-turn-helix domain-containing protein [Deltaproteobacteria bacterium]